MRILTPEQAKNITTGNRWPLYIAEGLGNRIFIIDERNNPLNLRREEIREIAKEEGGCDQIFAISPAVQTDGIYKADINAKIWNRDGSSANNCINGMRCVVMLLLVSKGLSNNMTRPRLNWDMNILNWGGGMSEWQVKIRVSGNPEPIFAAYMLRRQAPAAFARLIGDENFEVDPKFLDALKEDFTIPPRHSAYVNFGNPHLVLFLDESADLLDMAETYGKIFESRLSKFTTLRDGVNIGFAKIDNTDKKNPYIDLQVWERGAGITDSCGSGAAAAYLAANRMELVPAEGDVLVYPARTKKSGDSFRCWMELTDSVGVCANVKLKKIDYVLHQPPPAS